MVAEYAPLATTFSLALLNSSMDRNVAQRGGAVSLALGWSSTAAVDVQLDGASSCSDNQAQTSGGAFFVAKDRPAFAYALCPSLAQNSSMAFRAAGTTRMAANAAKAQVLKCCLLCLSPSFPMQLLHVLT